MNINREFADILYNLQKCNSCIPSDRCKVCAYRGLKLDFKYFEKYG